jgi:hypothetical protein
MSSHDRQEDAPTTSATKTTASTIARGEGGNSRSERESSEGHAVGRDTESARPDATASQEGFIIEHERSEKNIRSDERAVAENTPREGAAIEGQRPGHNNREGAQDSQRLGTPAVNRSVGSRAGPDKATERIVSTPEENWYRLEFGVARSLRYTAKRRAFFEKCNQIVRAIIAIAGAGTVATVFHEKSNAPLFFGAVVGFTAAIDLVFEFSKRTMTYDHLYRCYADLGIEIAKTDRTEENYRLLLIKRLQIEKDEPTSLDVLNVVCSNDELEARGHDHRYKVRFWQKLFCQFGSFGAQDFPLIEASREPISSIT